MKRFNALSEREYTSEELRGIVKDAEPGDPLLERFEKVRKESLIWIAYMPFGGERILHRLPCTLRC